MLDVCDVHVCNVYCCVCPPSGTLQWTGDEQCVCDHFLQHGTRQQMGDVMCMYGIFWVWCFTMIL